MTIMTEEERGTKDRGKTRVAGGGRVEFLPVRDRPGLKELVYRPPRGPVVLDEMSVTPSKQWQKQDAQRQAKQVLARVKQGRGFSEDDVDKLQKRLLSLERREELVGRESEGRQLASELGELRRQKLVKDAVSMLARAKEGRGFSEAEVTKLQQRLQSTERQDEIAGQESEGRQLVSALGEVRRQKLVADALHMVAGAKEGRRYREADIEKLQRQLLGMERQDELLGQESEGWQLALELGEVRRKNLVSEASNVLAGAKRGRQFGKDYVAKLQERLLGMERQDEMLGRESEGKQLAYALGDVRRKNLVSEALNVLARAKEGEQFPKAYVIRLQQLLGSMQRQDELFGNATQGLQLAADLAKLRH